MYMTMFTRNYNTTPHLSRDLSMLLCMVLAAARLRILRSSVLLNWNTI